MSNWTDPDSGFRFQSGVDLTMAPVVRLLCLWMCLWSSKVSARVTVRRRGNHPLDRHCRIDPHSKMTIFAIWSLCKKKKMKMKKKERLNCRVNPEMWERTPRTQHPPRRSNFRVDLLAGAHIVTAVQQEHDSASFYHNLRNWELKPVASSSP